MLSIYGSFTAPGVPDVVVYRDDENPLKFYMVSGTPRILRSVPGDPASAPMIDLVAWLRDFAASGDTGDVERGHLQMTVGLAVPPADQNRIRTHLRAKIADESRRGYRFLGRPVRMGEPELGYPPLMLDGEAVATTFDPELQIAAEGTCPAMGNGVNTASFSYALTQSGARLMKQALEDGVFPVVVRYRNLDLVGRIPAVSIRITGDRSDILSEIRSRAVMRVHLVHGGGLKQRLVWYAPPTLSVLRSTVQSLRIEIDDGDFRDADPADNLTQELERMAMTVLESTILPSLFEQAIPAQDETEDEAGQGWWVPDEHTTVTGSIDISIRRRDVVRLPHNANGSIGGDLTPDEARAAVRVLDATQPIQPHQTLTVLPNINFGNDGIFNLKVLVDYDQFDERLNRRILFRREFGFQHDTAPRRERFSLAMAADGAVKRGFRYRSEVTFRGSDRVVMHPPQGGWTQAEGEILVISYAQFGHVKVDLVLAPQPPEVVSVDVTLAYADATLQGAVQTISLSPAQPVASYLVNTGSNAPVQPYSVSKVFRLADGSTVVIPPVTANAASLVVTSPFEIMSETTFVARGDLAAEIEMMTVTATYADPAHDLVARTTLVLNAAQRTRVWAVRQVDKDARHFDYTLRVLRRNGSEAVSQHQALLGEVVTVGPSGAAALEVLVDAELVDWARFVRVLVTLAYDDPANGLSLRKPMMFTDTGAKQQTWTPLIADPARRDLRVTVRRIGRTPGDDLADPETTTDDAFIILR